MRVLSTHNLFFHPHHQMVFEQTNIQTKIHLSTMDLLVRATMKNAAKRDM